MPKKTTFVFAAMALVGLFATAGWSQEKINSYRRGQAQDILRYIAADVREHYYDPKLHGVDWDATVEHAKQKIDKAETLDMAFLSIEAALDTLNDSNNLFYPPERTSRYDYGWQIQMIGDHCYVTQVQSKSDAEAKGVKSGDEVLTIDGYTPTRDTLRNLEHFVNTLSPRPTLRLNLRDPAGNKHTIEVKGKITLIPPERSRAAEYMDLKREYESRQHWMRARHAEVGQDLMILKLPTFLFESEIDQLLDKARKYKALIVDLRGNSDNIESIKDLVGYVFENDVTIGDKIGRDTKQPWIVKTHRPNHFSGKLVVLVDGSSTGAPETFAHLIQIEKRGLVLGDLTPGRAMAAKAYFHDIGLDEDVYFSTAITYMDVVMTDGKSLQSHGVKPDQIVLPTVEDLAKGRDPVLARAAETLGVKLTPEAAGKMFPYEWPQHGWRQ